MILAILDAGLARSRSAEMLMAPVAGEPMIWRMVERVRMARTLTRVMVATSRETSDDALCGYLMSRGQAVFRGDPADVLGSYARCAQTGLPTHVAIVGADTPLIDPGLLDEAVRYAMASRAAFVANNGPSTYPAGLEVGVVSAAALAQADEDAGADHRGSVCAFIQDRPARFETAYFRARRDWSAMDWRADTGAGFALAREVFEAFHPVDPAFGMEEALDYLDRRPDLVPMRTASAA